MARTYDALKKAEAERSRAQNQPDPVIVPRRSRRAHVVDLARLDPSIEEQYQKLRGNLFANGSGETLRTVMVVGSRHGEGATTTCAILATLLARANLGDVALIDANLRTPSLHELFAPLEGDLGLTEITTRAVRGRSLAQSTPIPNLYVIPSGRPLQSPAALYQQPIAGLLADLRQDFRYVMLDCSPVEQYADAAFVAPRVDGIVMVVRSETTRIETAMKTKRQLEWAGGKVIGVVLNDRRSYIPLLLQRFL
jgi:capsular exopolysaccharide synthesis family protein